MNNVMKVNVTGHWNNDRHVDKPEITFYLKAIHNNNKIAKKRSLWNIAWFLTTTTLNITKLLFLSLQKCNGVNSL